MAPNPRIRSLVLVLLAIASSSFVSHAGSTSAQPLTHHAPIYITTVGGVGNFTSAGGVRSGTGKVADPYIISDWLIITDTSAGIHIKNTQDFFIIRNVFIQTNNFTGESEGVFLDNVQNGRIESASITNFRYGVWLSLGSANTITASSMWNNTYGIYMTESSGRITQNHLFKNIKYGVWMASSTDSVFTGNNASSNGNGRCPSCDGAGFVITSSSNNLFENNIVMANDFYGFRTSFSTGNSYRNNNVTLNQFAIVFEQSTGNTALMNDVTNNDFGFGLETGNTGNNITMNRVVGNNFGVYLFNSDGNLVYNNYLNNTVNAFDNTVLDSWNITKALRTNILGGPFTGGNFYADYKGSDADGDGIGDTPYMIQGANLGQQAQDLLPLVQNQPVESVNIIANPSFEQGVQPCAGTPNQPCPTSWDFERCEGVANATVALDSTRQIDGAESTRLSTGSVTPTGCFPGNFANRMVGFSQFRQFIHAGYNFTTLTDSPQGFSFWFQLQPDNASAGMAGFEVRVFGAESIAEMDYVFNPDPSLGSFVNNTGIHSFLFNGYQPGQWYHFSRDLKVDWMNAGLSLHYNFTLVQFQGFATRSGTTFKSETVWLDDVRAYVGTGPILSTPDFTITVDPDTVVLPSPPNSTFIRPPIITLTSLNGFNGNVHLLAQVSPPGLIVQLSSPSQVNNASLTLTLTPDGQNSTALLPIALPSTPAGTYQVTVTAIGGAFIHSTVVTVIVEAAGPDFSIDSNPAFITLASNGEASSNITLRSKNGFSGVVSLSTVAVIGIFPTGPNSTIIGPFPGPLAIPTTTIQPSFVFLAPNATAAATLTVFGNGAQQAFSFAVTIIGTSGPISHSTMVTVQVLPPPPDFLLLESLSSAPVVIAGGSLSIGVSLLSIGPAFFNGTVTLTGQVSPSVINGPVAVFNPQQIRLVPPGPSSSTVQVLTGPLTPPGNYTLTVTGTSGTLVHTFQVRFTVLPPPVITVTPSSGTVGSLVTVKGRGFPFFSSGPFSSPVQVEVTFDNQLVGFIFLQNSSFSFTFDVPLSQPVVHQIHAVELFPVSVDAQANFTVLPEPSVLNVNVSIGTIYFPGETAIILVQPTVNGQASTVASLQVVLIRPNGSNVTLSAVSVSTGLWKASYVVPISGSIGTYSVMVTARQPGTTGGVALAGFEVKPTWLQSHASTITGGGLAILGAGLVVVAWRKGFLAKRKDELSNP